MHMKLSAVLATAFLFPNVLIAGDGYEDHRHLLRAKKRFAENEIRAIAEPFIGVRPRTGIEPDLFSIRSTGVSTKPVVEAAMDLMRASLSAKGIELSEAIRKTDHTLREINDSALEYDEDLYFFAFMGLPAESEPWGWQIDGHHLIINYFVLGDQVVMTPAVLGGEPTVTTTGKYKGNSIFQEEQDAYSQRQ